MGTVKQNFEMWSGDAKTVAIAVTDASGAVVNLTGMTITWVMARHQSKTPLVTKTIANAGISVPTPTTGIFNVSLVAADTSALDGLYYHEAKIRDVGGSDTTVATGYATINKRLNP
jgi:ABC-type tungstate transport system substrate-binding protein